MLKQDSKCLGLGFLLQDTNNFTEFSRVREVTSWFLFNLLLHLSSSINSFPSRNVFYISRRFLWVQGCFGFRGVVWLVCFGVCFGLVLGFYLNIFMF